VLTQWPEPGVKVKIGRLVTYVVAIGNIPVRIPNLVGLNFDQAEKIILAKGLLVGKIEQEGANGQEEIIQSYKIIEQSPAPETMVKSQSPVDVVLEKKGSEPDQQGEN